MQQTGRKRKRKDQSKNMIQGTLTIGDKKLRKDTGTNYTVRCSLKELNKLLTEVLSKDHKTSYQMLGGDSCLITE